MIFRITPLPARVLAYIVPTIAYIILGSISLLICVSLAEA